LEPVTVTCVLAGPEEGESVIERWAVTVKVAVLADGPLAARTVAVPSPDEDGTVKEAEKVPVDVVVMDAGVVATEVPLKVIVTAALGG
jgi:hypothetical protein